MGSDAGASKQPKGLGVFERSLTVWVILCIAGGIVLGKVAPGFAKALDGLAIHVGEAPWPRWPSWANPGDVRGSNSAAETPAGRSMP